ncbi:MAG TPA: hypothetical protein PKX39_12885, partial [Flavobacteriales bacterium]|nr:hypothetical protein [Flavobacteriales bacterium]
MATSLPCSWEETTHSWGGSVVSWTSALDRRTRSPTTKLHVPFRGIFGAQPLPPVSLTAAPSTSATDAFIEANKDR